jgi:hypothetical protein
MADPQEFAVLAREQKNRIAGYSKSSERLTAELDAERENAEAVKLKADEAISRLAAQLDTLRSTFTRDRDEAAKRLLDGCPAVVMARTEQCRQEAAGLRSDSFFLPPEAVRGTPSTYGGPAAIGEIPDDSIGAALAALPRNVSNAQSVSARRGGLLALAEQCLDWTWKGDFSTADEFEKLFARAYSSLPKVEALRDVLARDVRGRDFVKTPVARAPLTPAA